MCQAVVDSGEFDRGVFRVVCLLRFALVVGGLRLRLGCAHCEAYMSCTSSASSLVFESEHHPGCPVLRGGP